MADGKHSSELLSFEQMQIAIETTNMGLWRWDGERKELFFDARGAAILGVSVEGKRKLNREETTEVLHPEDVARMNEVWQLARGGKFRDLELRILLRDGSTRWVSVSGTFLSSAYSSDVSVVGSCLDITERREIRAQLQQAQKMEAVGQLTAGIAHNFNNILSAILPNLNLANRFVQPNGSKFLRNAQLAAERATELISELMVVAGRKEREEKRPINLYQVVERVVRICRTTFGGWIQLIFDADAEDEFVVLGDEGQLEQVILNILLNARDAFESTATTCPRVDIELFCEKVDGKEEVVIQIEDNGPGMGERTRERVFEPFFTTKGSGTGLGLATAYAIVGDHGGAIGCTSEPEQGSVFELRLPIIMDESIRSSKPKEAPQAKGGQETIMVVDDDLLVRSVTTAALSEAGYRVVEAEGGGQALALQREGQDLDLVLLDLAMPEMTGEQLWDLMRKSDPSLKVLVFSGSSNFSQIKDAPSLQKPAGVNELLAAVRKAIDCPPPLSAN